MTARCDVERFAQREQADRKRRHFDAIEQFGDAESEPGLAGELVDADQAERQSDEQAGQSADRRIPEGCRHRDEGHAHQREIIFRPEAHREIDQPRRQKSQTDGGDGARDKRADRGRGKRRPAAAGLGHLVALERGRHRCALAGRVDEDRRGRSAIHAAVIDSGEHDQRAAGIELVGHRQQQRDRERGTDAGQHAHGGAEEHADQRIEQVHRLDGDGHAMRERGKGFHLQQSFQRAGGKAQRQQPIESEIDQGGHHERDGGIGQNGAPPEGCRRGDEQR